MPAPDPDSLSRLVLLIFRTNQALSSDGDALTAPWHLTGAKWKVLGAIALSGRALSAASIGRAMGLSRQAVLKQINLLQDQGMLARHDDPNDARAPLFALTRRGQSAYTAVGAAWRGRAAALTEGLATGSIDGACHLLETLLARLDAAPPAGVEG
jgi:DNA-binding MarR family transcriptional regulator